MTDRPRPGLHLFFLDDHGVLFSEPRQELHILNTTAAVIWCHLEDGKEPADIARALADGGRITPDAAAGFVADALANWRAEGFLAGTEPPTRPAPPPPRRAPGPMPPYPAAAFTAGDEIGRYRLADLRFGLRCPDPALAGLLRPLFRHLRTAEAATTFYDVVADAGAIHLYRDGRPVASCAGAEGLVPEVYVNVWLDAVDAHGFLLDFHAGVVARGPVTDASTAILLPGRSGSGKSTLTAALVRAGWHYLSDEVAPLDPETLRVVSVPIPLSVKQTGLDPVLAFWPEAADTKFHRRIDGKMVGYLTPPAGQLPDPAARPHARVVIFPRFEPGAALAWRNVPRAEALGRLMEECVAIATRLDPARVRALVDWMARLECRELNYGSTGAAVAAIQEAYGAA